MRRMGILVATLIFMYTTCWANLYSANLLENPGFELGLSNWVTDYGTIRGEDPLPHGGSQYFMGARGGPAASYTYQVVDLVAEGFSVTVIDSGLLDIHYGGWQSGWDTQQDSGKIETIFSDGISILGSSNLGWFYSNHTWVLHETTVDIPAGTRSVTFGFYAQRYHGTNNDGYLDDAFMEVVPEPMSVALLFSALGLFVIRRNVSIKGTKGTGRLYMLLNQLFSQLYLRPALRSERSDRWKN